HTVWIHNKLVAGTIARITASENFDGSQLIVVDESTAHKGYSLWVPENYTNFWLTFYVVDTTRKSKVRGPYNNSQDVCWRFH
ncbi:10729_t:CDS:1, partial [Gigaspora rosea]